MMNKQVKDKSIVVPSSLKLWWTGAGVRKCGSAEVRKCGSAEVRKCVSAGVRKCGSAGVRKCGSAGVRECVSTGVRECDHLICIFDIKINLSFLVIKIHYQIIKVIL